MSRTESQLRQVTVQSIRDGSEEGHLNGLSTSSADPMFLSTQPARRQAALVAVKFWSALFVQLAVSCSIPKV